MKKPSGPSRWPVWRRILTHGRTSRGPDPVHGESAQGKNETFAGIDMTDERVPAAPVKAQVYGDTNEGVLWRYTRFRPTLRLLKTHDAPGSSR